MISFSIDAPAWHRDLVKEMQVTSPSWLETVHFSAAISELATAEQYGVCSVHFQEQGIESFHIISATAYAWIATFRQW